MDFKPQIYFIDLDGTTLDLPKSKSKISRKNVEAIKKINKTKPVVFSTGRSNSTFVMDLLKETNSPYAICQNGGIIVDANNNILVKYEIQKDDAVQIIKLLENEKMLYIFNSGNVIYGSKAKLKFISIWARKYEKRSYDEKNQITNCTKILTFGKTKKGIKELKNILLKEFINIAVQIVSKGYALEITNFNATKGKGDSYICKLLNIPTSKAVHIGDSGNDSETINYLGAFICMGNGLKEIRNNASLVGPKFKKAGLAKLFEILEK